MSTDAIGSMTAALFGLDGFEVLAAADAGGELELMPRPIWSGVRNAGQCRHQRDPKRTWTERHEAIGPRAVRTRRAAAAGVDGARTA